MTQEEKAKRYDEALEKGREVYNRGYYVSGDLEYIFPEFKESEDEKVRKALIEYFNEQCDMSDWNGVYGYQVVAWLEKQGGQKSTEWDEYDEMYVNALVAIVRKRVATDERLRDELIGWLSCLKCRLGE